MKFVLNDLIFLVIFNVLYCLQLDLSNKNLRLLESSQENSVWIFPLTRKNGKYLVNIGIGSQNQNVSLIIDTASTKSLVYANKHNALDNSKKKVYDKNLSQSYSSNTESSKIEKIFYANHEIITNSLNGLVSYEKISINSDINNNKIEISNLEFLLNEDDTSLRESDGIFGISHAANIKINEENEFVSLLKKLSLDYKIKETLMLINNKEKGSESYLAFGDFSKISENENIKNFHLNFTDRSLISNCDQIQNNSLLTDLWSCSLAELILLTKEEKLNLNMSNSYFIIDTTIDEILIPENTKISIDKKSEAILFSELILNKLGSNCIIKEKNYVTNSTVESGKKYYFIYKYIECHEKPKELNTLALLINGKEQNITLSFYESGEKIEKETKQNSFILKDFLFYDSSLTLNETNNNSIWILGNNFLNNFQAIGFDEEDKKISFYSYLNYPMNKDDEESLFSFFVLSLLCVILLIIIVFLVPYILYRRRRKAMMEKLQYEIIYKKMNDITREYGK